MMSEETAKPGLPVVDESFAPCSTPRLLLNLLLLCCSILHLKLRIFRRRLNLWRHQLPTHLEEISIGFEQFIAQLRGDRWW
jgi:hypothetical protein